MTIPFNRNTQISLEWLLLIGISVFIIDRAFACQAHLLKARPTPPTTDNSRSCPARFIGGTQADPKRYNFALVPLDQTNQFTDLSQHVIAPLPHEYILEDAKSLPHISLCQIETIADQSGIESVFRDFDSPIEPIPIQFNSEINTKKGDGEFSHVTWVELNPTESSRSAVQVIHDNLLSHIQNYNYTCNNKSRASYQPHLTLGNILSDIINSSDLPHIALSGAFALVLGIADHHWQLTDILDYTPSLSALPHLRIN